jgi:predicted ATPase/class 3 adenylate cyclase
MSGPVQQGSRRGSSDAPAIVGERRQVTALFYDIVGSTELLQRVDPEEFAAVQRQVHRQAATAIERYSGRLSQLHGDGGAAYFGFPIASEDAAECAVSAALEIVARCRALESSDPQMVLQVRVGVATGTVIIAEVKDSSLPTSDEITGIAPALAARIQTEAEPNTVAVSEVTFRLTRSAFDYVPLGSRVLKGFAAMATLFRPVRKAEKSDRFSRRQGEPVFFVNRVSEFDECRKLWARARAGEGQMILLVGEAGIGKSRLALELRNDLSEEDCDVHLFQCEPRGNTRPMHPIVHHLERAIRDTVPVTGAIDASVVRSYFELQGTAISEATAESVAFLFGGSDPPAPATADPTPSADEVRRRTVEATLEVLRAWSRRRPQLILLEDLHWADTLTNVVVSELAPRIEALPVLVLVTSRESWPSGTPARSNTHRLALPRFDANTTALLSRAVWGGATPHGLDSFIQIKSDGVPLYAEELIRLLQTQLPRGQADRKTWDHMLRESGVVTLQDLISAKLNGLGELRRVAQTASIIGREFPRDLLAQIIDRDALPVELDEALDIMVESGVLTRNPAADSHDYRFRHVLLQEAAYDSLLKADRRQLHQRVAHLISSGLVPRIQDDVAAWHFEQAGWPFEAARCAIRAAEACAVRSAIQEADQMLGLAESQLDLCDRSSAVTELRLNMLEIAGPVAAALHGKGSRQARRVYEEGVALCHEIGHEARARWFSLYWGWWFTAPDFATQQSRSEIIVHDLEEVSDQEVRLQSLHCAWATGFHTGRHIYCLRCVEDGLALYHEDRARVSRTRYGGHDAKVCALGERALSLWFMGNEDAAEQAMRDALAWAEAVDHLGSRLHALNYEAELRRYQNDFAGLSKVAAELASLADEHSLPSLRTKANLYSGWAQAMTGSVVEGLATFEAGLAMQREIGTEENLSVYLEMQSEILSAAGRFDEALKLLDPAIGRSLEAGQLFWLPELYRRRALLLRALGGDPKKVRSDLEHALALAEEQEARSLARRAQAELAQLGG